MNKIPSAQTTTWQLINLKLPNVVNCPNTAATFDLFTSPQAVY